MGIAENKGLGTVQYNRSGSFDSRRSESGPVLSATLADGLKEAGARKTRGTVARPNRR